MISDHKDVYPGQKINISILLVRQLSGTVPGIVIENNIRQYSVPNTEKCQTLLIRTSSNDSSVKIIYV